MNENYIYNQNGKWKFKIDYKVYESGKYFVADIFPLGLSTQARNLKLLYKRMLEVVTIFLDETNKMGNLEKVLVEELKWRKENSEYSMPHSNKVTEVVTA